MLHDAVVVWPGSCNNVAPRHAHWFDFQYPTCRNTSQQGNQTRATCCAQQCCDMLHSNVAIVWQEELADTGPTMLRYVALKSTVLRSFGRGLSSKGLTNTYGLLTKLVRSRWLDIGRVLFFLRVYGVEVHKHTRMRPISSHHPEQTR